MAALYLVATPIGNLDDIPLRALETFRTVDVIASEDTRKTGMLLHHFKIDAKQLSFHEHNEEAAGEKIIALLHSGRSVALVTNAGTPGISDPGFTLVRRALQHGIPMTMVPGPCAFVTALVLSGLPVHSFTFRGFPPRKRGARQKFFEMDRESRYTMVYYESPYRLGDTLEDALSVLGDRQCAVANDLTKRFESIERGTLSAVTAKLRGSRLRGEYTLVIAGADRQAPVT